VQSKSKDKKILITGGTGLLGMALIERQHKGYGVIATYSNPFPKKKLPPFNGCQFIYLDITDRTQVANLLKAIKPDILIHTASIGKVDYCQEHQKEAWRVNVEGSNNLIEVCKRYKIKFIFTSSNAVFDGSKPPYNENDPINPINFYGKTKAQTEKDLEMAGIDYTIVRLITMYGWNHSCERSNPVTWVLEKLKSGRELKIVNDVYNNHLFVGTAAEAIWAIVIQNVNGIYHIAGKDRISRYELSVKVGETFGLDKTLITPVSSAFFPAIALRPKDTCYETLKMKQHLKIEPIGIKEGLTWMRDNPPRYWQYEWMK